MAILFVLSTPGVGLAQSVAAKVDATALRDYRPSMGDLMTMAVQPRHIKRGLAGQQKNWAYAKYELRELRSAFARIGRTIPTYQSVDTATLTAGVVCAPLNALEQAIDANSATQFNAAYIQLTEACNNCHRNRKHSVVVIKVPATTTFPLRRLRRYRPARCDVVRNSDEFAPRTRMFHREQSATVSSRSSPVARD